MKKQFLFTLIFAFILLNISYSQEEARLMRFPAIHGNQIVFSYAGDLYTVETNGGYARKLTNDIGYEMFSRFSPDGKTIAFTGQYDGNTEVFTIPAEGGVPKRQTYTATLGRDDISDRMGPNNIVMSWTRDGKNIIYRSRKQTFNDFQGQLFSASINGGLSTELPLPTGGFCSYSPDGKQLAFNRVMREFRTWKYYKGGMADDIWIYDFATKKTINITNNNAQDIIPMWHGNNIYFLSDRNRTMNLFVYNTESKEIKKVTNYTDYDIKFPSIGDKAIIFEKGGFLFTYDLATAEIKQIHIKISEDFNDSRNLLIDASKHIRGADLSPNAERLVFSARGDIFTVPAKSGITRNLTETSGAHDRNSIWSPDGKYIAYISDVSGEYEIYIINQDGSEKAIQLTKNADTYKYSISWSPDSKKILWNDKKNRLQYVEIESKKVTIVEQSKIFEFRNFSWSHDSKWITYARPEQNQMNKIILYNLDSKVKTEVTNGWYSSSDPSFSDDGKYLIFTSNRDFEPIYSQTEWNHAYRNMSKIYLVTLEKATPNPLTPEPDEVELKKDEPKAEDDKKDKKEKADVKIDIDGIQDRIVVFPTDASNYWNLNLVGNKLFYNEMSFGSDKGSSLKMFDLKTKKESVLGEGLGYSISANNKKMLISKGGKYYIIDLPSSKITLDEAVDVSNMQLIVKKKEEWKQIYDESWRQMRDFFYVENMHGVDWKAMHDKYAVLVSYVNNRNDLNYIIGELIGELSVGHAYVSGGDKPKPKRIQTGLLGAKLSRHSSGYYKVDEILKGENWRSGYRSPLSEVGVNVAEGSYILAIDGKSTKDMNDIYETLVNKAGKQVEMIVGSQPNLTDSRKVMVTPISDEANLYYFTWVQGNIEKVNKATNGEVGYIHIPDMVSTGLNEFAKYFYPQLNKKALVIDGRGNGGGNVSPMIIERLRREITRANMSRNSEVPGQTPRQMMNGPMVLIVNNYSASDGDLFPYSFKKHGIGKVVGLRTWGGVVGIRGSLPFIDGGQLNKPEFASYSSEESKWIIEGYGVEPDVVVDNDPAKEYAGEDEQLNKAIEIIKEELKNYKGLPPIPKAPDKSK
ncbi:MAG: PDZ domain-containing protein [Saprospiraceae bacterium]|nr:PDZ domain-containing protein [Saprospiraceae bacterium]